MEDKTILIGIGHKARHGKDTLAQNIVELFGGEYDIRKYSFAAALKAEVNGFDQFGICFKYGVPYDFQAPTDDPLCNTKHGKQSKLLQFWGEYRRKQDPFYWVKRLHQQLALDKPQFAVIPDMRYLNELLYVKSRNGYTVKCTRNGFVDLSRDPNHVSEVELDNAVFDYEVTTEEGDVEELRSAAVDIMGLIVTDLQPKLEGFGEALLVQGT